MSKALVINGANFFANKITTVTLEEIVPCEGIVISDVSHSFTAIGVTYQLSATVSPVNATDTVTWNSTDENVVTVDNTGLVTCVGVGTASIIVTCGTKSAVCTISASITVDANSELLPVNLRNITSTDLSAGKNYVSVSPAGESGDSSNAARSRIYASNDATLGYYKFNSSGDGVLGYPIPIPDNTSTIQIETAEFNSYVGLVLMSGTELTTYSLSSVNKGARAVSDYITPTVTENVLTYNISEHSGYDSFVVCLRAKGQTSADLLTGDVTFVFS